MKLKTTRVYDKNYKRLKRSGANMDLLDHTVEVLLSQNQEELLRLHDHSLQGKLKADREIHVGQRGSNWVLRYRFEDGVILLLLATGTHGDVLGM